MKLDMKFGEDQVVSAASTKKVKMKLSDNAQQMVFAMFTKNVYSNPIGSIVREITSNCYDAHAEAGVNTPVIVEIKSDLSGSQYISFIDKGIGMSPERVEKVYSTYFESTKRDTNTQIGGFGIGGKTPLAYTNSFFVETVSEKENEIKYNNETINQLKDVISIIVSSQNEEKIASLINKHGEIPEMENKIDELEKRNQLISASPHTKIRYMYSIYKGQESPEIELLNTSFCDEHNGTEVKVPIKNEDDLCNFKKEVLRQLYYFENIIFKGFPETEYNNYKIYKGKTFLFRINKEEESNKYENIHVCLGQVVYPIDYSALNLNAYDYEIPVALKLNVGDINVTASRENLDYNDETKQILISKLQELKQELAQMLTKQYENVSTLNDYYNATENFGYLNILDTQIYLGDTVNKNNISFTNFKFKNIISYIPRKEDAMSIFLTIRRYGKRKAKSNWRNNIWNERFSGIKTYDNIYHSNSTTNTFKRKNLKQSYLNYKHDETFFVILKTSFDNIYKFNKIIESIEELTNTSDFTKIIDYKQILSEFQKDLFEFVVNITPSYEDIEVPNDYVSNRKNSKLFAKDLLNREISVNSPQTYRQRGQKIRLKTLYNFKGRVFYGYREDSYELRMVNELFNEFFNNKMNISYISTNSNKNNYKGGIMFIQVSKQNANIIKNFTNVHYVNEFYGRIMRRKISLMLNALNISKYKNDFNTDVSKTFKYFEDVDKNIYDKYVKIRCELDDFKAKNGYISTNNCICALKKLNVNYDNYSFSLEKDLRELIELSKKLEPYLQHIYVSYNQTPELIKILQLIVHNV